MNLFADFDRAFHQRRGRAGAYCMTKDEWDLNAIVKLLIYVEVILSVYVRNGIPRYRISTIQWTQRRCTGIMQWIFSAKKHFSPCLMPFQDVCVVLTADGD